MRKNFSGICGEKKTTIVEEISGKCRRVIGLHFVSFPTFGNLMASDLVLMTTSM